MILRSKGIVNGGADGWLEFDYVPGEWEVRARGADVGLSLIHILTASTALVNDLKKALEKKGAFIKTLNLEDCLLYTSCASCRPPA